MKEPTGDAPWEEDDASQDVVHLSNPSVSNFHAFKYKTTKLVYDTIFLVTEHGKVVAKRRKERHIDHVLCPLVWILQETKTRLFCSSH